ncbi:hypothetical protein HPB52_023203 [Rhipicephalus sanguineus]|uniref:Uncharacterized protein n=1 Tax=Rhipicephalus sanguineus TaxID=34632 RepID=A0A9D4T6G3_RHISA|nr:hypothetical protein HPB52_023203 [Rhipicephalus sanguineus]
MSIETLITSLANHANIRGLPLAGLEEVKVMAYADFSLFVRDARSLQEFQTTFEAYAQVSGAAINKAKSKALLFGSFPTDIIGDIQTVNTVKVLGVYFSCEGVAATT